jgi:hypothetical protein
MEPMSAFEQQLSRVASEVAGPAKPVDAMAVACSAQAGTVGRWSVRLRGVVGGTTTTTERGFSVFSAVKFVVAGVIVAAFSSMLLLSGVFSPQPVEPVPGMTAPPTATASGDVEPSDDPDAWAAVVLPQAEDVSALATGVAVGPDSIVAVGRRACERMKNDDIGRCWGQPWISTDGVTWEAVEARTSGLDLGRFYPVTSGPEIGVEGVAHGPGGFVAYGRIDALAQQAALWHSVDGRSWERVSDPEGFDTEGQILSGPWLHSIAGSEDGYLLGGVIYAKPAPRAAIWSSTDGLTWTLAEGEEIFDVGAYIDTMETPATGGIDAIAITPSGSAGAWYAIAVGSTCPQGEPGAGPKGGMSRAYEWTTGQCRAQAWRSTDGLVWERLDLPKGYFGAGSVATDGSRVIIGVSGARDRREVIASSDGVDWAAHGGQVGREAALATVGSGFRALVPTCLGAECLRRTLTLWSSADGVSWRLDPSQPEMPGGVQGFLDVDMAAFGDRVVTTAGYWTAPRTDLASMALLSPPLTTPLSGPALGGLAAPAQAASPPASDVASATAASSPAPDAPTTEEADLLAGVRLDLQETCTPVRTNLPETAVAGIECHPPSTDVERVRVYLFDTQADLLHTYLARLVAQGVEPGTASGRCVSGQASEGPYVPSPEDGLLIAERGGCYADAAGLAHYLATNPPFVMIELDGTTGDMAALEGWAWLGNEDQPGNPTIWREVPVDTEK